MENVSWKEKVVLRYQLHQAAPLVKTAIVLHVLVVLPGILRPTSAANAATEAEQASTTTVFKLPKPFTAWIFSVECGLDSLSFNGQSLFRSLGAAICGQPNPFFARDCALFLIRSHQCDAESKHQHNRPGLLVGRVSCAYRKKGEDGLVMEIGSPMQAQKRSIRSHFIVWN